MPRRLCRSARLSHAAQWIMDFFFTLRHLLKSRRFLSRFDGLKYTMYLG